MHRLLIQCLAMLTMLASVVHAQCLIACSFQTQASAATVQTAVETMSSGEHSCCPHQSGQKPSSSEKPCSPSGQAVTTAASEPSGSAPVMASPATLERLGCSLLPPIDFQNRFSPPVPIDGAGPAVLSSISILRI